jgi:hypothetical protein
MLRGVGSSATSSHYSTKRQLSQPSTGGGEYQVVALGEKPRPLVKEHLLLPALACFDADRPLLQLLLLRMNLADGPS